MSKMTSAAANKLLKKLNDDLQRKYAEDAECATYIEVVGQSPVIPEYDFAKVHDEIRGLIDRITKIKHALNVFNSTTNIPGVGITIDAALVRMSMLTKEKSRLDSMVVHNKKTIRQQFGRNSGNTEYTVVNYDVDMVRARYEIINYELTELQLQLDVVNSTVLFDVEE